MVRTAMKLLLIHIYYVEEVFEGREILQNDASTTILKEPGQGYCYFSSTFI